MSKSDENLPSDEMPRYRNKDQRVRVALSKFYGISGEEWSIPEIAEHLNLAEDTVESYIYDSETGEDIRGVFPEAEEQARVRVVQKLMNRLDQLEETKEEVMKEKKIVPQSYRLKEANAEIDLSEIDNVEAPEDAATTIRTDVPVPDRFAEIPDVDKLRDLWREERLTMEQIEDLFGLEEPDELDVSEEKTVQVKRWEMTGESDNDLPEQEVIDLEEGEEYTSQMPDQEVSDVSDEE